MPFQPINYASIPVRQGSWLPEDLVENFMKFREMPGQNARKREEEELANQFKRLQIQQLENPKPSEFQQKIDLFKQFLSGQNPFGSPQGQNPLESSPNINQNAPIEGNQNVNPQVDPKELDEMTQVFMRNILGLPAEFPNEKKKNEIEKEKRNLANQIQLEGVKSGNKKAEEAAKTKEDITTATKTRYEKNIDSADALDAVLDELEKYENPSLSAPWIFGDVGNRNKYKTLVTSGIEKLMSGENWLGIAPNVEKAQEMLSITPRETVDEYRDRIKSIRARVKKEKEATILKQGKKGKSPDDPFGLR